MSRPKIYLDNAAATPLDSEVLAAMQPFLTTEFYNPSATYLAAKKVRSSIDDARTKTARVLGVRPREIIFTAGATEANNLAIHGVMSKYPDKKILVSAIEHGSVLNAAKQFNYGSIPVDSNGQVNIEALQKLLNDDVVFISIMYANNEIGTIQQLLNISKILAKIRAERIKKGNSLPLYFHTDAAQAPNYLPILVNSLGVDMMSLNGGKIYGPKQSGALYIATGVDLQPLIYGGGQEFGIRSGTENVAGIIGFSSALEKAASIREAEAKRINKLQNLFISELESKIPDANITAPATKLFNIIHVSFPEVDNERLMMELDEHSIMCAVGSACSASSDEPSHVLKAIGLTDQQAQSSLRFSMGRHTSEADVLATVKLLKQLI